MSIVDDRPRLGNSLPPGTSERRIAPPQAGDDRTTMDQLETLITDGGEVLARFLRDFVDDEGLQLLANVMPFMEAAGDDEGVKARAVEATADLIYLYAERWFARRERQQGYFSRCAAYASDSDDQT